MRTNLSRLRRLYGMPHLSSVAALVQSARGESVNRITTCQIDG